MRELGAKIQVLINLTQRRSYTYHPTKVTYQGVKNFTFVIHWIRLNSCEVRLNQQLENSKFRCRGRGPLVSIFDDHFWSVIPWSCI